jgi:hypothetical protein
MSSPLIFQQIPKVMAEIEAVSKSRDNKAQGFKFRGIDDVINEVSAKLSKHRLFVVPEVLEERREERQTKTGGVSTYVILKIKYTLFAEDGSSISAVMIGEGADSGDKASNKAQSIALKYFLLQVFAIPTEEAKDPDAESHDFVPKQNQQIIPPTLIETPPKPPKPKPKQESNYAPGAEKMVSDPWSRKITFGTKYFKKETGESLTITQAIKRDGPTEFKRWLGILKDNAKKNGYATLPPDHQIIVDCFEMGLEQRKKSEPFIGDVVLSEEEELKVEAMVDRDRRGLDWKSESFDSNGARWAK